MIVPQPAAGDSPVNEPITRDVAAGTRLTARFVPEQRNTTFVLPIVAVSKRPNTTYEVRMDGNTVYGPAPVPPTDPDDLGVVWMPARQFSQSLEVVIRNLGSSERPYVIQPVGWEEVGNAT
jgi:hypothetical protein